MPKRSGVPAFIPLSLLEALRNLDTPQDDGLAEIADEVVNARVWAGVHWRTSCTAGRTLGHSVAELALARAPRRLN